MKKKDALALFLVIVLVTSIIAFIAISAFEVDSKGTITGLTLVPLLVLVIVFGAVMVAKDIKEFIEGYKNAPDAEESEDDE